ncbi:hypothetical protein FOL01_1288 [Weissella jogaejeotgali]|uniref:SHOCT domain-containing protein n=1 Tax=Weissella jogaejeotgali TaxID=1631871 RepID=A0A1L6RC53_9LACO|nr:hypothetical protein [Weissella jogaejeotgali]APS42147.1 hypothetical protein FOL01_1288 [Weissella jogaejeotgali]
MSDDIVQKMKSYKQMLDDGLIDEDDYNVLKQRALTEQAMDINFQRTLKKKEEQESIQSSVNTNSSDDHEQLYTVLGFGSALVSLGFVPILFGTAGVIFGYLLSRSESSKQKGTILMIASIGCAIMGMLIGVAMQGSGQQENNFFIFPWY